MNALITILLIIAGIIALLLVIALFMKKECNVRREIIIDAPRRLVFDYIRLLKNQDGFNKHEIAYPDRIQEFKGLYGTGYIYICSDDKNTGAGEKGILSIVVEEKVEMGVRLANPIRTVARILMETASLPGPGKDREQTKLSWSSTCRLNYPVNIMIHMMEKHIAKDTDTSLSTLKNILEKAYNTMFVREV